MHERVKPTTRDPLNVNERLYKQLSDLLDALDEDESITTRERIAAMTAIARIQIAFMSLRKEGGHDPAAGSAVRKYASAFSKGASNRGKKRAGSADAEPEPDPFAADDFDDDGDGAA